MENQSELILEQQVNDWQHLLLYARHEAIARGQTITLCPSRDTQHCLSDWGEPMMMFIDHNGNRQRDGEDQLLRKKHHDVSNMRVHWQAFGSRSSFQYQPTGFSEGQNGTFIFCSTLPDPRLTRGIIIARSGRARLTQANEQGIHQNSQGQALECPF